MKFTKGLIVGGLITTGIIMMYGDRGMNTSRMMKKGRKFIRKMGIM